MSESQEVFDDPLDPPVAKDLKRAFMLPSYVRQDEEMVDLYDSIVSRLRREADGLPMTTVTLLLLERIASLFVILKYREENNQFTSPSQHKDLQAAHLAATKEFYAELKSGHAELRDGLIEKIQRSLNRALNEAVVDKTLRADIRNALTTEFEKAGV